VEAAGEEEMVDFVKVRSDEEVATNERSAGLDFWGVGLDLTDAGCSLLQRPEDSAASFQE
jgi:hypothetical protein